MHHKFAIIDGSILLNGSFNWTRSAVITNRENIVITANAPALLAAFLEEFNEMWSAFEHNVGVPAAHHPTGASGPPPRATYNALL